MTARMQMCVQKGFDALEPDNIDGYTNSTGFPLTAADQLAYNEWIATTAHSLGLSVGLKNDVDQTAQLEPYFDWALDEQCNQYSECDTESVFTNANKAVFNAEYGSSSSFCAADIAAHINGVRFDLNLDGATDVPCGGWGTTSAPTTTTTATTTTTTTVAPPATTTTSTTVSPPAGSTTSTTVDPPASSPTTTTTGVTTTTTSSHRGSSRKNSTSSTTSTTRPVTTTTTPRHTPTNNPTRHRMWFVYLVWH
jgi:hypothetical protein